MIRVICISFLCLVFLSCKNVYINQNYGDLYINFGSDNRTLQPDMDAEITSYTISFSNSIGLENFTLDVNSTSVKLTDLYTCNWNIIVEAKNTSGEIIGYGSGNIEIRQNEAVELNIDITPFSGIGIFNLSVEWLEPILGTMEVTAILINDMEEEQILTVISVPESLQVVSDNNLLESGYYQLVLTVEVDGETLIGLTEKVKIVKDKVTNGSFIFNKL